ncbi:RcnB family protein [Azospirillum sp. ST 5-10]|uniref:RcnB family protein n=1 Tax=unclassified Azospirillum TaxID=2630922 RepID=UPI003F4A1988
MRTSILAVTVAALIASAAPALAQPPRPDGIPPHAAHQERHDARPGGRHDHAPPPRHVAVPAAFHHRHPPPRGHHWIRHGRDAVLVLDRTGVIVRVVYGAFR